MTEDVEHEFCDVLNEFFWSKKAPPVAEPVQAAPKPRVPYAEPVHNSPRGGQWDPRTGQWVTKPQRAHPSIVNNPKAHAAIEKMNAAIMPPIQQAFRKAMDGLKQDLQAVQLKAGANPKIAPHAWEVINRFYKTVMQAGMNYQPNWKVKEGDTGYDAAYQKAAQEFRGRDTGPTLSGGGGGGDDPLDPRGGGALATRGGGGALARRGAGSYSPGDDVIDAEFEVKEPAKALPAPPPQRLALPAPTRGVSGPSPRPGPRPYLLGPGSR
jgi:hypothetical protein